MPAIFKNDVKYTGGKGGSSGGGGTAQTTTYNNQNSGLKATNVQEAIDEIAKKSGIYLEAVMSEVYVMHAEVID